MRNFLRFFTLLVAICLVGCGATLPKIKPYKMDIQQGNVVTSEMLLKLRPGMTKSQVKFIMGTPLLVDSFRTNRWDYFYQLRKQGKIVNQRRVILDFEDDLLKGVRGDVVPKGATAEDVAKQLEKEAEAAKPAVKEDGDVELLEPVVTPLEVPAIEATDEASEVALDSEAASVNEGAAATASVLAVPIAVEPVVDAGESAPGGKPMEALTPEPVVESEAEVLKETPVLETAESIEPSKSVLTVMPSKVDADKLVFRLDRSLDTTRIIPQEVSGSEEPLKDSVVQGLDENDNKPPATQDDPSFFERMLEKIGF